MERCRDAGYLLTGGWPAQAPEPGFGGFPASWSLWLPNRSAGPRRFAGRRLLASGRGGVGRDARRRPRRPAASGARSGAAGHGRARRAGARGGGLGAGRRRLGGEGRSSGDRAGGASGRRPRAGLAPAARRGGDGRRRRGFAWRGLLLAAAGAPQPARLASGRMGPQRQEPPVDRRRGTAAGPGPEGAGRGCGSGSCGPSTRRRGQAPCWRGPWCSATRAGRRRSGGRGCAAPASLTCWPSRACTSGCSWAGSGGSSAPGPVALSWVGAVPVLVFYGCLVGPAAFAAPRGDHGAAGDPLPGARTAAAGFELAQRGADPDPRARSGRRRRPRFSAQLPGHGRDPGAGPQAAGLVAGRQGGGPSAEPGGGRPGGDGRRPARHAAGHRGADGPAHAAVASAQPGVRAADRARARTLAGLGGAGGPGLGARSGDRRGALRAGRPGAARPAQPALRLACAPAAGLLVRLARQRRRAGGAGAGALARRPRERPPARSVGGAARAGLHAGPGGRRTESGDARRGAGRGDSAAERRRRSGRPGGRRRFPARQLRRGRPAPGPRGGGRPSDRSGRPPRMAIPITVRVSST